MNYLKALSISIFVLACSESPKPEKTGLEGKILPTFDLLMLDSTRYLNTGTISDGKPFVLFYVSPECTYCKSQMEGIIDDMEGLKDIQFYIVTNWSVAEMKKFATKYQLHKYSNITVGIDQKNFLENYFQTRIVPYTAIYGKNKRLSKAFAGKIYPREIKTAIKAT